MPGFNLDDLEHTSQQEIAEHLQGTWRFRGHIYRMFAVSMMDDYAPTYSKLHDRAIPANHVGGAPAGTRINQVLLSIQNIHSYVMLGWETGIENEFYECWRMGMTKEQIMELVMFTQQYAGMRGLGHTYRAVGDWLPTMSVPDVELQFPEGWAADPDAFRSGLDLTTREMTPADRENLTGWYERTIGYVPKSIVFGLKYHPDYTKVCREKWEHAITTLPKQVAPYLMLRHNTITQSVEGLRESALLAKAWGVTKGYVLQGIAASTYYFTGLEGSYAVYEALDDILEAWE